MPKRYNTPHRSRVVKTRLSEEEYADFTARLAPYGISQSEFLRQAIRRTAICRSVTAHRKRCTVTGRQSLLFLDKESGLWCAA